ncbi:MAG: hypothetical protein IKR35_02595 [Lachnospiraceae bacterium]|nr:hypothetical protein [Lachnospiraceae bacterium]
MERDLFGPVKEYFEKQGYICDGEVEDIDLYMERGEEHVAVELKVDLDFKALRQAALRQKYVETVYIAVFKPKSLKNTAYRDKLYLLKRLGIGLLLVSKRSLEVQVANEPVVTELSVYQRQNQNKKKKLNAEFSKRRTKNNVGGVRGEKLISAYREDALLVLDACAELGGEVKGREVRKLCNIEKTADILRADYYGWFEKIETGVYRVTDAGYAALEEFEDTVYKLKRGN